MTALRPIVRLALAGALAAAITTPAHASGACDQPMHDAIAQVATPGLPFEPIVSNDGCWLFVSVNSSTPRTPNGVAVYRRGEGRVKLVRVVPLEPGPSGMVLTHDGRTLIVADDEDVVFLDTARLESGRGDPVLGYMSDGDGAGSVYVNVTSDDRTLFVSDEHAQQITVIDLARARQAGYDTSAIVGRIPVGRAPIALTLSPDGRLLYTTSQLAPASYGYAPECRPEGRDASAPASNPPGAVIVVDVARARTDPANAVLGHAPAGCNPVRLVLSPGGDVAYVTARASNAVLAFDTAKLISDPLHARLAEVPVGTAPVGIAVIDGGRRLVVTNSNRFAGDAHDRQVLSVIDATRMTDGAAALLGTFPAGAFPRELRVADDGRTLLLTNYMSRSVEVLDLTRVHPAPAATAQSSQGK